MAVCYRGSCLEELVKCTVNVRHIWKWEEMMFAPLCCIVIICMLIILSVRL